MNQAPLPQMSRHEASWHEHLAGMRAAEKAREQGGNPEAIAAIASATAGPVVIAGYVLQRAGQGTIWTLQRLAREFAAFADAHGLENSTDPAEPGNREMLELGLATLAFCDARGCWQDLDAGRLSSLILRADEMMWSMPIETQLALQAHFTSEMDRIRKLSPGEEEDSLPGKSLAIQVNGISLGVETHPVETASLPVSGSLPNTESTLELPYGKRP